MLIERIEHKWLLAFEKALALCQLAPGQLKRGAIFERPLTR